MRQEGKGKPSSDFRQQIDFHNSRNPFRIMTDRNWKTILNPKRNGNGYLFLELFLFVFSTDSSDEEKQSEDLGKLPSLYVKNMTNGRLLGEQRIKTPREELAR